MEKQKNIVEKNIIKEFKRPFEILLLDDIGNHESQNLLLDNH